MPGNYRLIALIVAALVVPAGLTGCQQPSTDHQPTATVRHYDLIIRDGSVYDGSGNPPRRTNLAIHGDRIAALGPLDDASADQVLDARGLAVSPGFINMLSWAPVSLLEDGRSQSDIRQGVTLEVFGEGWSMGPLTDAMRAEAIQQQGDIKYSMPWTTLNEFLEHLETRGVATNIASFVGATTLRIHAIGRDDRPPSPDELNTMQALLRQAMQEGALGVGSSLIYAPAFYADTAELTALAKTAAEFGGSYISHIRSEGNNLLEAVDELIQIARDSGAAAEIYHLKAAGEANWPKLDEVFARVNQARAEGLDIRANMYTYTAGATGLNAAMPPWVQEGGHAAWVARLQQADIRTRLIEEMRTPTDAWENLYMAAGGPEQVILIDFRSAALKPLTGKTLAEVMAMRGTGAEQTMIDLVIEDDSRVGAVFFLMSEDNVAAKIAQPWMGFGSDEGSYTNAGVFLNSSAHPRAYGTFARLLGHYVRDQQVISLSEAIRRLTSMPAENLKIRARGLLKAGYFADLVIFDPATVIDHASYTEPHQYATGVRHVLVNGELVLKDGEHTGATPGLVVRGPGWTGHTDTALE